MFEMYTIHADFCHKWKPVYSTNLYNQNGENVKVYYKLKYAFAVAHSRNRSPTKPSNVSPVASHALNMGMNHEHLKAQSNLEILSIS